MQGGDIKSDIRMGIFTLAPTLVMLQCNLKLIYQHNGTEQGRKVGSCPPAKDKRVALRCCAPKRS